MNEEIFTQKLAALFTQRGDVLVGPGDDCAVLDLGLGDDLILAAADQAVSSIHYLPDCPPEKVARKVLCRNISDIAAMGGTPTHALVTLALNPMDEKWLSAFHESLEIHAASYGMSVIGGDISALPFSGQQCSLSIFGKVKREKLCLRSNAKPGDLLYATGFFGNSFTSEWHLDFIPRLRESEFLAGAFTNTMMDVSDGLLKDSCRMARASGLGIRFDVSKIRLRTGTPSVENALSDGEDYELIFAVNPSLADSLEASWPYQSEVPLSRIGIFVESAPGTALNFDGSALSLCRKGFDHFST